MTNKLKIMSLSVEPETHTLLKTSAKKGGYASVSAMVRELVSRHLELLVHDGEEIPVILRVPSNIRGDKEALDTWFAARIGGIVDALARSE